MKSNSLTIKQESFCQAYIRLGDKSAAYREAYSTSNMKDTTIHEMACKLSSSPKVSTRISELQSKVATIAEKKFNITAEEMLRHLNILRNSRIDEYVEYKKGRLIFKDFDKLSKDQLMCIESIKQDRNGNIEIKLHGKDWTIEKINKHIGFYAIDNKQKNDVVITNSEDRDKRIQDLVAKANGKV